jgi:hypothetical protein
MENKSASSASGVSSAAAKVLYSKGFNPKNCLITKFPNQIQKAHLIPQSYKKIRAEVCCSIARTVPFILTPVQTRRCEWLLGYAAGAFSVDSHYNLIPRERCYSSERWWLNLTYLEVKSDLHGDFDAGCWALVPIETQRQGLLTSIQNCEKKIPTESTGPWPPFDKV